MSEILARTMMPQFPRMMLIKQKYPLTPALDVRQVVREQLARFKPRFQPGARIAIAVGSRGIANLQLAIQAIVAELKQMQAEPFILPAMGSHGGATPEGQAGVLAEYGITESAVGIPLRAAMEVERVGTTPQGIDVFCSREALRADGIILFNRVKPHTDFAGKIGSGLLKLSVIGLGKQIGAARFHVAATRFGYEEMLREMARVLLARTPIRCGLAVVENQRHETARIVAVDPADLEAREEELFLEAKRLMPKLPFEDIDFLIVDRIGKNISGSGMDPNVVGRSVHGYSSFLGQKDLPPPRIKRIFVRDLTAETHGNAIGIGFADLTTTRLVEGMDRQVTYVNALTSLTPNGAKIPIYFPTDREALGLGLSSAGLEDIRGARVVRITDTLSLEHLEVSEAFAAELAGRSDLDVKSDPTEMRFDPQGNLAPFAAGIA